METTPIQFGSAEFMDFLAGNSYIAQFFALGEEVIVVVDGIAYQSTPADDTISATQNQSQTQSQSQRQATATPSTQENQTTTNTSSRQIDPTETPSPSNRVESTPSASTNTNSNASTPPRSFFGGVAIGFVVFIVIGGALIGVVLLTLKKQ